MLSFSLLLFITGLLEMNMFFFGFPSFTTSLLEANAVLFFFIVHWLSDSFHSQTSPPRAGDMCSICYHPEAFHHLSPSPNTTITNDQPSTAVAGQLPPPTTSVPASSPPLFTHPAAPPVTHAVHPGVPANLSMPILRSFEPFQSQPSSTSEENWRKSMVQMNSSKPK